MPNREIKKDNITGNTTAMLITCMGIAVLLWLANKFSQEYNTHLNASIQYINIPDGLVLRSNHSNNIQLTVKTKGFSILRSIMTGQYLIFEIDAVNLSTNASFILTDNLKNEISAKLPKNTMLINISPDTLFYSFEKSSKKSIEVALDSKISFQSQYGLSSPVIINPTVVIAQGAQSDIMQLHKAITEAITLNDVKTTQSGIVKLKSISGITFTPDKVNYTIPVAEYTEKEIDIDINIINEPQRFKLELFPKKAKIKCMVSLQNYEKVKPELFEVIADFKNVDIKMNNKISLQIIRKPTFVKNIDFQPKKTEYIVFKK